MINAAGKQTLIVNDGTIICQNDTLTNTITADSIDMLGADGSSKLTDSLLTLNNTSSSDINIDSTLGSISIETTGAHTDKTTINTNSINITTNPSSASPQLPKLSLNNGTTTFSIYVENNHLIFSNGSANYELDFDDGSLKAYTSTP